MHRTVSTSKTTIVLTLLSIAFIAVPIAAQTCGNGIVEPPEECDDGAAFRLDGCAPDCTYEHVQRMTLLELIAGTAPLICTPRSNAFGGAFSTLGLTGVNTQLATAIGDGSLNQLLQMLALDDPAAVNDPDLEVGMVGSDLDPRGSTAALDGWYLADAGSLDGNDLPSIRVPGLVTSRELEAGPARIDVVFIDGTITIRDAHVTAVVGSPTSPPAPPPDQLAGGFSTFETLQATDGGHGLCGNLTVGSLAIVPLPEDFASGGAAACSASCAGSRSYTWCGPGNPVGPGCNSLLDVLVSGCAVTPPLCFPVISPTQPDVGTGGQPPQTLVANPTDGKVTVVEPEDAYSTWLEFNSQRVHLTNHLGGIFTDGFDNGDLLAWSASNP
jgi:cysteine-rich repeat protein